MVKLTNYSDLEEMKLYFDYDNNFNQLLEDYLESPEMSKIFADSKSDNWIKFRKNQKYQLKKLNEKNMDEDPPRIKLFKTWMTNYYEQKKMKYHKKDNDLEKDELIRNLKNELLKKNETIIQLENENKHYLKKIKKLRKQFNLDKPKPTPVEDNEPAPEPEPKPEPPPQPEPLPEPEPPQEEINSEILKRMDPDYDSDDDIVEKSPQEELPSIYSNNLTEQEEKEKDDREQMIKAQCEAVAREREENIEKKTRTLKILDTYYSQCDLEIDKMEKKFNKEVKKADRTNKYKKMEYSDSLELILIDLQDEYCENYEEISDLTGKDYERMVSRPVEIFYDNLPCEMVQIEAMNK